MKRLAALFAVCCLLFGVTACSDVTIQKETPPVTTGIMAADNPLLTAPPFQANTENAAIVYDTLTQAQIAEYEQALKQAGYESGNDAEHFWYNGTSMLRLSHNFDTDSGYTLDYYKGLDAPHDSTPTAARLTADYMLEMPPADLYERTGAQFFLTMTSGYVQSYLVVPESDTRYLLDDGWWQEVACADIDGDGETEILTNRTGPTSGVYSFGLAAYVIRNGRVVQKYGDSFIPDIQLTTDGYRRFYPYGFAVSGDTVCVKAHAYSYEGKPAEKTEWPVTVSDGHLCVMADGQDIRLIETPASGSSD